VPSYSWGGRAEVVGVGRHDRAATLAREIGGMEERIAGLESSRDILAGYLRQDTN
jgi:hypothetical protein